MSFYGKPPEADPTEPDPVKRHFKYRASAYGETKTVEAENVYFHHGGYVGFWNDRYSDPGKLVLATRASEVWED